MKTVIWKKKCKKAIDTSQFIRLSVNNVDMQCMITFKDDRYLQTVFSLIFQQPQWINVIFLSKTGVNL